METSTILEALPWNECKPQPHYGVNVACRANTIVVTSSSGDLLFRAISDNSKTWIVGNSAASFSLDWLNRVKDKVDTWIEAELKKLEEKERAEAAKVWPPVPPDGYRLCSKEEAENETSCAKLYCKNQRWHELVDLQNIRCPLSEFYCTSAPRKFVRCTPDDANRLFTVGAYIEFYAASFGSWARKTLAVASDTNRYRVDKYTIPEGFKLQPVMPTVRLPDGAKWKNDVLGLALMEEKGFVWGMPTKESELLMVADRIQALQALLDAYDETHDGET